MNVGETLPFTPSPFHFLLQKKRFVVSQTQLFISSCLNFHCHIRYIFLRRLVTCIFHIIIVQYNKKQLKNALVTDKLKITKQVENKNYSTFFIYKISDFSALGEFLSFVPEEIEVCQERSSKVKKLIFEKLSRKKNSCDEFLVKNFPFGI